MGTRETIYLAGGCFWCVEAVFDRVKGVLDVVSGYCNGQTLNPTYEQVCSGTTGHAEVVKVEYDPSQIQLKELLEIFFVIHDPTTLNRQGNDVGTQYRSGIFFTQEQDEREVNHFIKGLQASQAFSKALTTQVQRLDRFYEAETYHQEYFTHHPEQGYCAYVVAPKVEKFLKTFASKVA
ncbi:MAG: peptide-methionine (S)-S-oxide reductase MsrA [Burkholderiaceae bacterium]